MGGKASRDKGHNFERFVAGCFRYAIGRRFERYFGEIKRGFQTRGGSSEECDVLGLPFNLEAKKGKSPPGVYSVLRQAEAAKNGKPPAGVICKDRLRPVFFMYLDDMLWLMDTFMTEDKVEEWYGKCENKIYSSKGPPK